MDNAQLAAFLLPFLMTLMVAVILLYMIVKAVKGTVRVATAPVRYARNHRR